MSPTRRAGSALRENTWRGLVARKASRSNSLAVNATTRDPIVHLAGRRSDHKTIESQCFVRVIATVVHVAAPCARGRPARGARTAWSRNRRPRAPGRARGRTPRLAAVSRITGILFGPMERKTSSPESAGQHDVEHDQVGSECGQHLADEVTAIQFVDDVSVALRGTARPPRGRSARRRRPGSVPRHRSRGSPYGRGACRRNGTLAASFSDVSFLALPLTDSFTMLGSRRLPSSTTRRRTA